MDRHTSDSFKKAGIFFIIIASFISFLISVSSINRVIASPKINNQDNKNKLDIRFLVDMSYSMRKNDPNKFRIRSLQKLIKNLPENSTSGVWTYAKYVNMLVPIGDVDYKWKKKAIYQLDKIKGYGSDSNLLAAMQKATYGWQDKASKNKHIVILTDSGLNLSDNKIINTRAKLMLLSKMVPKLKKSGIKVNTISIGKNSDERLLKLLASQTGGKWYYVDNMNLLSSVTQHMYQQAIG